MSRRSASEDASASDGVLALRLMKKYLEANGAEPDTFLRFLGVLGDFARFNRALPGVTSAAIIELCEDAKKDYNE